MKIRINGIFEKYNNEFDFDNKEIICIGENGIGKSTSLRILECILNLDFINILNYYFDYIELIDDETNIKIKYDDIAISFNYLKEEITKLDKQWNPQLYYQMFDILKTLIRKNHYKVLRFNINKLKKELKDVEFGNYLINILKDIYINSEKINDGIKYYAESKIKDHRKQIIDFINKLKFEGVFILNLAKEYIIKNNIDNKYVYNEYETSFTKKNNENKRILDTKYVDKIGIYKEQIAEHYEVLYNNFKYNIENYYLGKNLDIGEFLFSNIYSKELLEMFKNDYYKFLYENIYKVEEIEDYKIDTKDYEKMKIFLKPILPQKSLFDEVLDDYTDNYYTKEMLEFKLLNKFYHDNINKYININNERLIKLNRLFKKYFKNKEVIATPFGICISNEEGMKNDLDFEDLSEGEKKIIILLTVVIFSKNMIILLDEPESSLATIWQKKIINDIIENSSYRNLIVCTQSPFIVTDNLIDKVICLPMEKSNEE